MDANLMVKDITLSCKSRQKKNDNKIEIKRKSHQMNYMSKQSAKQVNLSWFNRIVFFLNPARI